jgi:hypothetical protein
MNLIWVPNQHFALYFLAFCRQYSSLGDFSIFVQDEAVIPEMRDLAGELNINFITREDTRKTHFEYFIMFSYGLLSYQEDVRASVRYEKLLIFGDQFNNTFYLHALARDWKIHGLVFFGYELIDNSFISMDLPFVEERFVISLSLIAKQVKELQGRRNIRDYKELINDQSHLILDRYWGTGSYQFRDSSDYRRYLNRIMQTSSIKELIIFKKVESTFSDVLDKKRKNDITEIAGHALLEWESVVQEDSDFRYLTSPEALFLGDRIAPNSLFAFDSSTSLIGSICQSNLKVVWPDNVEIHGIFKYPFVEELIKEKSRIYREVASKFRQGNDPSVVQVHTDGVHIREFLGRFVMNHFVNRLDALTQERDALTQERDALTQERDALTQERDALTQERDALTQERDALTQERDALTQERDALINSTIWRVTRPLRKFLSGKGNQVFTRPFRHK